MFFANFMLYRLYYYISIHYVTFIKIILFFFKEKYNKFSAHSSFHSRFNDKIHSLLSSFLL